MYVHLQSKSWTGTTRKNKTGVYGDSKLRDALRLGRDGILLIRVSKELGVQARTIRRHRGDPVATPGR